LSQLHDSQLDFMSERAHSCSGCNANCMVRPTKRQTFTSASLCGGLQSFSASRCLLWHRCRCVVSSSLRCFATIRPVTACRSHRPVSAAKHRQA